MKKLLLLQFGVLAICMHAAGQGKESKLPLYSNPVLENYSKTHTPQNAAKKTHQGFMKAGDGGIFPFIERFTNSSPSLSDSLWVSGNVKKSGSSAVMDAQDAVGNTYDNASGSYGACDILTSRHIDLSLSKGRLYIQFSYSTGSTWNNSDSLVLQFQTGSGNYRNIWSSPDDSFNNTTVIIENIDMTDYVSAGFHFRFVNYTNRSVGNTENFIIHHIVMGDKWGIPTYENFFVYDSVTGFPSADLWIQRQTERVPGALTGKGFTCFAAFDSKDENGVVYQGGSGALGYADTLMSHPMDILQFQPSDSVYLRFYYRPMPNVKAVDSLILEYRNNVGAWIRVWQTGGPVSNSYFTYINQVNIGRYRHPRFQFRLIGKCNYTAEDIKFIVGGVHIGKKSMLPFLDDFSNSTIYPDQAKWLDKDAYINNDFPINPPSINVATFDGLDFKGRPYGTGTNYCDTLTSAPLNLSKLFVADSLYLSFWVQTKGLGNVPNSGNVLELQFRNSSTESGATQYTTVWTGFPVIVPTDRFVQVFVPLRDTFYFHDDFQFRFRNYGNLSGNLNHWHVDYIRLDRGRFRGDSYNDLAINSAPGSLLTPYSSMPYRHFNTNPSAYTKAEQLLRARNNSVSAYPVEYEREVFDPTGTSIDFEGNIYPNFSPAFDTTVVFHDVSALTTSAQGDSLIFTTMYKMEVQGGDNLPYNDTLSVNTVFSNYFSYDDGTAESGYGIAVTPGKVALGYELAQPDTLHGASVFFNRSYDDVSQKSFDLYVWKAINTNGNGTGEDVLMSVSSLTPQYTDKINGFHYYRFPNPLFMPAGKFYIGWKQSEVFNLNIGCDENFTVNGKPGPNPQMFFLNDDMGIWRQTELAGALMFRPIIGGWIDPPAGEVELQIAGKPQINMYPNPASDILHFISAEDRKVHSVSIFDISGKQIFEQKGILNSILLPLCSDGLYFIRITDDENTTIVKKLVIRK